MMSQKISSGFINSDEPAQFNCCHVIGTSWYYMMFWLTIITVVYV